MLFKRIVSALVISLALVFVVVDVNDFIVDIREDKLLEDSEDQENEDSSQTPEVAETVEHGDFVFEVNSDGALVLKRYGGDEKTVNIPSSVDGRAVVSIGKLAFNSSQSMEEVVIPESVLTLESMAFFGCAKLRRAVLPSSLEEIGPSAYRGCAALKEIVFAEGGALHTIGRFAFSGCRALERVSLPDELERVEENAFSGCMSLKSVRLGRGLTFVGDAVFSACEALESVVVGADNCASYGSAEFPIFKGCVSLTEIIFEDNVKAVGDNLAYRCEGLTEVGLPSGLESIGDLAFAECISLSDISLPEGLKSIGSRAFYGSGNVSNIEFGDSINSIGSEAFIGTKWYNDLPDGLIYIKNSVFGFKGDTAPEVVIVKDGTRAIADYAFFNQHGIKEIILPSSITDIGGNAFLNCACKITFADISTGCDLKRIGEYAFAGYRGEIITLPASVEEISPRAFSEALVRIAWAEGSLLKNIEAYAFEYYKGAVLEIPEKVEYIGEYAFYESYAVLDFSKNEGLTSFGPNTFSRYGGDVFLVPDKVTSFAENCFAYTSAVPLFSPNATIRDIDAFAFKNYEGSILLMPESVESIDGKAFENCYSLVIIGYYGSETAWSEVNVHEDAFKNLDYLKVECDYDYGMYFEFLEEYLSR